MTAITLDIQQKIDIIEEDEMFSLRKCDWKRIKRRVDNIPKPSKFISISYSILLGIFGSTFLSLITLKNISNLEPWIIPFYFITTIFSFLFAIILFFLEKRELKYEKKSVGEIKNEFKEIESLYIPKQKSKP